MYDCKQWVEKPQIFLIFERQCHMCIEKSNPRPLIVQTVDWAKNSKLCWFETSLIWNWQVQDWVLQSPLYGFRVTYEGFLGINSANQGVGCLLYLGMFEIAQLPEQVSRKAHQSHGKKLLHKLLFPYLQGQKFSVHSTLL